MMSRKSLRPITRAICARLTVHSELAAEDVHPTENWDDEDWDGAEEDCEEEGNLAPAPKVAADRKLRA